MKQREQSVKASISLLAQQRDDIKDAYGTMVPIRAPVQMRKAKKRLGLTIQPNRGIEKNKGKIGACQSDWVTPAAGEVSTAALGALAVIIPSAGSQYTKQQRLEALREGNMSPRQQLLVPVALSDFLLLDIPLGLADKVDRLLFAAALRCFVPDFFPHHSLKEAYAMYRQMPNGLMKVRYEQCAYGWSQPIVSKLKMKGLGTITDLLPLSKCDMFLRSVATPLALLDAAKDIIVKLQNYSNFPKGLNHAETRDRTQAMMAGEFVSTLERPTSRSHKNLNRSDQIEVIACSSAFAGNQDAGIGLTFAESFLKEAIQRGSWTNMSAPVDELLLHAAFMICENVENVIATMVSVEAHNTVQSNQSSVYDSAAKALGDGYKGFKKIKVSEFDPDMVYSKNSTPGGSIETLDVFGNEKSISLHGHDSFIQFSRYLEYLSASNSTFDLSEMKQREAIRERYRTALLLSTPFELNLKSQGVNTVAQLARYDLSSLDLPSLYRTQIESMLSTAIAASVGVKEANKISTGSHLPPVNNQIAFKVPLVYDSKFQRGPFDPYGIPPRLNLSTSLSEASISEKKNSVRCVRKKQKKVGTSRSDIDAPIGLPLGLWSTKVAIDKDCKHDSTEILLYEESRAIEFSTKQSDLSKGRSVSNFLKTLPGPREARRVRDQKEFNGTFERPYKCTHKGCNEAFSRPYTLRMHEKSHLIEFRDYTNYRNNPQYCLDANTDVQRRENETRFNNAAMLPQFIQNQLNTLCR